jgi:hypothetical protein
MLRAIERDGYSLRSEYPERKSLRAGLWMGWLTLTSMFVFPRPGVEHRTLAVQPVRIKQR